MVQCASQTSSNKQGIARSGCVGWIGARANCVTCALMARGGDNGDTNVRLQSA
jgi:hypothetical protein